MAREAFMSVDEFVLYLVKSSKFNLKKFIKEYSEAILTLWEKREKVFEYQRNNPLDLSGFSKIDQDKFELYLAYQNLIFAENVETTEKQRFLYYVSNYFMENSDFREKNLEIKFGSFSNRKITDKVMKSLSISQLDLYERYRKILIENPELKVIDFSFVDFSTMNLEEAEEYTRAFFEELKANWELLPNDVLSTNCLDNDLVLSMSEKDANRRILTEIDKELQKKRAAERFMAKKVFYGQTDPYFIVSGKNTFDGYIGFIYSNGMVILDKFYDSQSNHIVSQADAIYYMNVNDFHRLSNLSKTELIGLIRVNQNNRLGRIVHKGNWQEKVESIIKIPRIINPNVEVSRLVNMRKIGLKKLPNG